MKLIYATLNISFLVLLIACSPAKHESQIPDVKTVFTYFKPSDSFEVVPALDMEERKQLLEKGESKNWKIDKLDIENNTIELIINDGEIRDTYLTFVVFSDSASGSIYAFTKEVYAQNWEVHLWKQSSSLGDVTKFEWIETEIPQVPLRDFFSEYAPFPEELTVVDAMPYIEITVSKEKIVYSINTWIFFKELPDLDENIWSSYIKYDYAFTWKDGKFETQRTVNKEFNPANESDGLPVINATVDDEEDPDGPGIDAFDCGFAFTATASSVLPAQGAINYSPSNVLRINTEAKQNSAWSTEGSGIGQWIEFTDSTGSYFLGNSYHVRNGYVKSKEAWKNNSRVKKLKMFYNGSPVCHIILSDTDWFQSFSVPHLIDKIGETNEERKGTRIRFEIEEIYPGEKYNDTVISYFVPTGNCG